MGRREERARIAREEGPAPYGNPPLRSLTSAQYEGALDALRPQEDPRGEDFAENTLLRLLAVLNLVPRHVSSPEFIVPALTRQGDDTTRLVIPGRSLCGWGIASRAHGVLPCTLDGELEGERDPADPRPPGHTVPGQHAYEELREASTPLPVVHWREDDPGAFFTGSPGLAAGVSDRA